MYLRAIAVASLVLLGACSDPDVKEPRPSPSASASPALTPPTMPAQARENSSEGAAAFVSHWVDVSNHAAATGDVGELATLSSTSCEGCVRYIELYRNTYDQGGYFRGSDWSVGGMTVSGSPRQRTVTARISAPVGTYKERRGAKEKKGNAENSKLVFQLKWSEGGWHLQGLSRAGAQP